MTLSSQALSHVRKVGLVTVAGSLGAVVLAALALPPAILPMIALIVPFIAAGIVESSLEHEAAHA